MRKYFAELLGTAFLVFCGAGVATLMFGFKFDGGSVAAGVVAVGLTFGLVVVGLAYAIGPISGCHVNPAVTLGVLLARRMSLFDAIRYWVAQFVGGIVGALILWAIFEQSPIYRRSVQGLGAQGYGSASLIHVHAGGAFLTEVVLTAIFVFVILGVTSKKGNATTAGLAIGPTLGLVNIVGVPIDGTSVNPARSFGPALIAEGTALSQVWLFIVAPLVGAVLGVLIYRPIYTRADPASTT